MNATIGGIIPTYAIPGINGSLNGVQYNQQGLITWVVVKSNTGVWRVFISGTIEQSLTDYPGLAWTDIW